MTARQYADIYLEAKDPLAALNMIESGFIKEMTDVIREKNLIHTPQLVPVIESLQGKWADMRSAINSKAVPGILPVNPSGFLEVCKNFFPAAYYKYREKHP